MDPHDPHSPDAVRGGRAFGALFFAVFGGGWLALWAWRAFASPLPVDAAIAVLTAILATIAWRIYRANAVAMRAGAETQQGRRQSRVFNLVNAGQWVVIVVLGNVLANTGLADWVIPMAIFVIGLHFLPLARLFANPPHYVTGAALMTLAAGYPFAARAGAADPVGCLGAGLVLWASAGWALRPGQGRLRTGANTPA